MPRKKTANASEPEPSSQPVKKFKADPGDSTLDDRAGRRSLRTRSQDENKADCNTATRSTRSSANNHVEKITSSRPRRNVLHTTDDKYVTRGSGFVVKSPVHKQVASCPLEVSVQVTPCDLSERVDKADSGTRKRKVKTSPKSVEKKSKVASLSSPNSSTPGTSSPNTDSVADSASVTSCLKECSVKLDMELGYSDSDFLDNLKVNYEASLVRGGSNQDHVAQAGLPLQLPDTDADPLFTRPVLKARSLISENTGSTNETISVMTYNILADCHRLYNDDAYKSYTSEGYLDMDYRGYRIIEEIKHFNPDVVCLQEVDEFFFNSYLERNMQILGYKGIFYKRKGEAYPEGASTFYRTSSFILEKHHAFSYTQLAVQDIDRSEHTDDVKKLLRQHVDKEAVLLVCTLSHLSSQNQLVIGNTHLTWTKFTDLDISCMQACYAFKEMDRLSGHGELPLLLVGDFNTRTMDPGYQLATDGYLNDDSIKLLQQLTTIKYSNGSKRSLVDLLWCAFQHSVRNVYSSYLTIQGVEPEVTSRNFLMNHSVDYMWASQLRTTSVIQVNKIEHAMPNIIYPSDHVSLQATYAF